jgi:allophanate hydrolase
VHLPSRLELGVLRSLIAHDETSARRILADVHARVEAYGNDNPIWLHRVPRADMYAALRAAAARQAGGEDLPLFGVPFAVKDSIDVAGLPTTAGWPAYRYIAAESATVVRTLERLGAILVGKTNMDQLATGLTGTRSPLGPVRSIANDAYVAGGSSSGSAVAVAAGLVSFTLGTDSGGSGRIPAAFNGVVGLKPTRGLVSLAGTVPNSRTLDCMSIFAASVEDATEILEYTKGFDPNDPFSRRVPADPAPSALPASLLVIGVPQPADLDFLGSAQSKFCFEEACARLRASGARVRAIDFAPFREAGSFILSGPWIAERIAGMPEVIARHGESLLPVIRTVFDAAAQWSATDYFQYAYRLAALRREVEMIFQDVQVLVVPSAPRPMTVAEVAADPIGRNVQLGAYSYFVNPLDLCAVAIPTGIADGGVPFGITLVGPAFADARLSDIAAAFARHGSVPD